MPAVAVCQCHHPSKVWIWIPLFLYLRIFWSSGMLVSARPIAKPLTKGNTEMSPPLLQNSTPSDVTPLVWLSFESHILLLSNIELVGNENWPCAFAPASPWRTHPDGRGPHGQDLVFISVKFHVVWFSLPHQLVRVFRDSDSIMQHIAYKLNLQFCITHRFWSACIQVFTK